MANISRTGSPDLAIAVLAERQHGIVSRRQLRALGLTDSAITRRVTSGSLHPVFHGSFAVGHRAIGRPARMIAAVLACGDGAVVSHGSAAELIGLWDRRPIAVDLIAPGWSGRAIQHVHWHNVRRPETNEVEMRQGIPCTTPSRTIVDMAGRLSLKSLQRLVEQAAVLRLLDVDEVDRVLARGRRRGAPHLRSVLASWRSERASGARLRSLLEARVLPALVEADLPLPRCNVVLRVENHRLEVDLLWEEQKLVIETDGEQTHGTRHAFRHDRWRDQVLIGAGYRTARLTWDQLEDEPDAVVARIGRMLSTA